MDNNFKTTRRHEGRIFAGLILVGAGVALLLRNTGFPIPYWIFSWPVFLIAFGMYSGIKHNFKNNLWIILVAVGGFFLVDRFIPGLSLEPYFWPVAIIAVGLIFILRPERNKWSSLASDEKKNADNITNGEWKQNNNSFTADNNDQLHIRSVFSGIQKNIVSKNFRGGRASCIFGGADIDLTQAEINETAEIRFEILFGGIKLVVPPHWMVYNQIDGVFHGVDDKRKFNASADAGTQKILVLKGSVVFGGVDIRSY